MMKHSRLRRTSPISQYAVAASLEALGDDLKLVMEGQFRLGILFSVMAGCVNYSGRFYSELLNDPSTASPIIFPETVFNAPASHLGSLLGITTINYTLVGDPGMFLIGLAMAAQWLDQDQVDGCLVIGAEEVDWLTADVFRLFDPKILVAEGAGAVYLRREPAGTVALELAAITDAHSFLSYAERKQAAERMRRQLPEQTGRQLLCDGLQGVPRLDAAEAAVWRDWPGLRLSPKSILGEGLACGSAWQCVAALDALRQGTCAGASISVVGCNQQAIGGQFVRSLS
jgi:hypothetical protein